MASFVVNLPSNRLFEIVCTTDPQLLRAEYRGRRTAQNFFTSRSSGLLRAPAGHATYLVPGEQLKRFAGQRRVYYVLASYDGPRGDDLRMSIQHGAPQTIPSIQLSDDFTGKSLDRGRIRMGSRDGKYGGPTPVLTWGGDKLAPPRAPAPKDVAASYDDGFSPDLWTSAPVPTAADDEPPEPEIVYDEAGLGEAYGRPVRSPQVITSAPRPVATSEPAGFEDPAALRRAGASYGRVTTAPVARAVEPPGGEDVRGGAAPVYGQRSLAEPPGIEDARGRARFGDASSNLGSDFRSGSPAQRFGTGVDPAWAGDDDELDLVASPGTAGEPLTIRRKFEILAPAAAFESGEQRYTAVLGDVDQHGLHWGLVMFTQRSGQLGQVLAACEKRDPAQFRQVFGAQAESLLAVTTAATPEARLALVGDGPLTSPAWLDTFRAAGAITAFQAAQNEVAIERDFDPNLGFAVALGLVTDRGLAMIFDRTIHMGLMGARRWILSAVSPITGDTQRATALAALGHADLAAFQRASGLDPTGRFGTQTHAALLAALRALGERSPLLVPPAEDMLDLLVDAAVDRGFAARVRELRTTDAFTDAVQRVV
ncbi:MAG: hypothetical protein ABI678_13500 [Kofleriaceae bacterium]